MSDARKNERIRYAKKLRGSFADAYPHLAREWHPTKNAPLSPADVSPGSARKVWWRCARDTDHEWQGIICNRRKQPNCPICVGQLVIPKTSLAARFPDVAAGWDTSRNGEQRPEYVAPASNKEYWWKCAAGHSYIASVEKRTRQGRGCPFCAGRRADNSNSLATLYPAVAAEWDRERNLPKTPEATPVGTHFKAWWICAKDPSHRWQARVEERTRAQTGCPICMAGWQTSLAELRVLAELRTIFPGVDGRARVHGQECDIYIRDCCVAIEVDGDYWHRENLQKDKAKNERLAGAGVHVLRMRAGRLSLLSNRDIRIPSHGKLDFEHVRELLRSLMTVETVRELHGAAIRKYLLRTDFAAHEDFLKLREVLPGPEVGRSLASLAPAVAAEWHPTRNGNLTPSQVHEQSSRKAWWVCQKCGHEYESVIAGRTRKRAQGCPACAGKVTTRTKSLAHDCPAIAGEWHPTKNRPLTPETVTRGSARRVWWLCRKCGNEWQAKILNRTINRTGCPRCHPIGGQRRADEPHREPRSDWLLVRPAHEKDLK